MGHTSQSPIKTILNRRPTAQSTTSPTTTHTHTHAHPQRDGQLFKCSTTQRSMKKDAHRSPSVMTGQFAHQLRSIEVAAVSTAPSQARIVANSDHQFIMNHQDTAEVGRKEVRVCVVRVVLCCCVLYVMWCVSACCCVRVVCLSWNSFKLADCISTIHKYMKSSYNEV